MFLESDPKKATYSPTRFAAHTSLSSCRLRMRYYLLQYGKDGLQCTVLDIVDTLGHAHRLQECHITLHSVSGWLQPSGGGCPGAQSSCLGYYQVSQVRPL